MSPVRGHSEELHIHAFLGIAPTLVLCCFCREGGAFDEEAVGLATTLLFFLFFSPSTVQVLSASCESLAELTSLSENMFRSSALTSSYSKSCSYVCLMCRWSSWFWWRTYCRVWPWFNFLIVVFRFFRPKMRIVMLSRERLAAASLRLISTPSAAAMCSS